MSLPQNDDEILLLHNPRCSKSRATKALLDEAGACHATRLYLEQPLTPAELRTVGERLGLAPADWIRSKESAYSEAGLSAASTPEEITAAVAAHPELMERPVVIRGTRAVIGRPPESVHGLLN